MMTWHKFCINYPIVNGNNVCNKINNGEGDIEVLFSRKVNLVY